MPLQERRWLEVVKEIEVIQCLMLHMWRAVEEKREIVQSRKRLRQVGQVGLE